MISNNLRAWKQTAFWFIFSSSLLTGCSQKPAVIGDSSGVEAPKTRVLPVVTQAPDEIRQEMKAYEPSSPQFEEARFKLTVVLDEIRKREGVEGFQTFDSPRIVPTSPTFYIDPQSHKLYWRAIACWSPNCPGRGRGGGPFLFVRELPHVTVGSDGNAIVGDPDMAEMMKPVICPVCKLPEFVHLYDLPESILLERELMTEFRRANQALAKAVKAGDPLPTNLRSIQDITRDLENIPKLFLAAESGKVKKYEAFTAPEVAGFIGGSP